MEDEPWSEGLVKARCKTILKYGDLVFSKHAYERMEEWDVAEVDVKNVIRGGTPVPGWENGGWRYQIRTPKIVVVVAFRSAECLVVVTTWRNEQ